MSDEEDAPCLPPDTLAILKEFLENKNSDSEEDWQLSQFWYNQKTTETLSQSVEKLACENDQVALISCPTLCQPLLDKRIAVTLFEFDRRFEKFGENFVFYDYKQPMDFNSRLYHNFDLIIADPPFLSEECLSKTVSTVNLLKKDEKGKVIICTGAVMEEAVLRLAQVKPCSFVPQHNRNLANEFRCYTNFGELP